MIFVNALYLRAEKKGRVSVPAASTRLIAYRSISGSEAVVDDCGHATWCAEGRWKDDSSGKGKTGSDNNSGKVRIPS